MLLFALEMALGVYLSLALILSTFYLFYRMVLFPVECYRWLRDSRIARMKTLLKEDPPRNSVSGNIAPLGSAATATLAGELKDGGSELYHDCDEPASDATKKEN